MPGVSRCVPRADCGRLVPDQGARRQVTPDGDYSPWLKSPGLLKTRTASAPTLRLEGAVRARE
jgi:hypothetical protein